jgi:hypothetical protein
MQQLLKKSLRKGILAGGAACTTIATIGTMSSAHAAAGDYSPEFMLKILVAFVIGGLLIWVGYKLLKEGSREEKVVLKFHNFELTLSSVIGSFCILAGAAVVMYMLSLG